MSGPTAMPPEPDELDEAIEWENSVATRMPDSWDGDEGQRWLIDRWLDALEARLRMVDPAGYDWLFRGGERPEEDEAARRPGWLSGRLAQAVDVSPILTDPFWKVVTDFTWTAPDGDHGSGSLAWPALYSAEAARKTLTELQADPQALRSMTHPARTYTATRWRLLRFESWMLTFVEEEPQ